jgi:hypothetical protein
MFLLLIFLGAGVIAIISGVLWGGKDDTNRFLLTHAAHNHIASHGLPVMCRVPRDAW